MDTDRRPITILFTDIVGSTTLAEKLDPEEWQEIVNGAHRRVTDVITRYEGTVAQLLGDGVLAFFGAPRAHEDDPARAVRAGLDIQHEISEYAHELRGYVENFQMRVGINTGHVVVGGVGSAGHMEYLAVGDAVNLAARLQGAAQPGTVLISEVTARLVQSSFDWRDLGEISVKGKAEPVRVFQVIGARAGFSDGRGIAGLTSPLVGRERELGVLRDHLQELRAGQGQIVFVLGEAGIGKSRLVEEARLATGEPPIAETGAQPTQRDSQITIRFLEGRALSYGQALSFWTIRQLLQNDLGLADGEPEIRIQVALRRRVKELFGTRSDEVLPYLAHLLGVQLGGAAAERVAVLDGETLKRQVLLSIVEYIAQLAHRQPTVLVFEDLHWADPSSLNTLERLLRVTDRAPLMVLVLMRPETDKPAWHIREVAARDYRRRFHELQLEALSTESADQMVNHLLAVSALPGSVRQLILERAEGNPFYLEEIIRSLIEQGAIVHDEGGLWRAQPTISQHQIPGTLQALLLARIDRLQDDVKRTLQLASVIGRSFLYKLLEAISNAERELDWHIAQLEHTDLIREKTRLPELEYMFKHSLTQEAAYESLLHERRSEFHRRVGTALESLFAERQDEFLGLLAYHFDRAGDTDKAVDYLIRAGDRTRLEDAHQEAITYYRRAIHLLQESRDLRREANTWLKLALIYQAEFEFAQAHEANENAFALHARARARERAQAGGHIELAVRELRFVGSMRRTLDPGRALMEADTQDIINLFGGLVEIDSELNVVPHGAQSWEILEDGARYVFHLRDDMQWTNGERITAADYEWALKRNLRLNVGHVASLLDDIVGAHAFRLDENGNSDSVGIQAIDLLTLEIRLNAPTPFFLYILGLPVAFPLHRATLETYGDEWWKPQHIVTNGPYRLVENNRSPDDPLEYELVMERNVNYFGEIAGNVGRAAYIKPGFKTGSYGELMALRGGQFRDAEIDLMWGDLPHEPTTGQVIVTRYFPVLSTWYLLLNPAAPPLDSVTVRRALFLALDRQRLLHADLRNQDERIAEGGLVPPGLAGHSPAIALERDVETARRLLAEAGYPGGSGFPVLVAQLGGQPLRDALMLQNELKEQWHSALGIHVQFVPRGPIAPDVLLGGWNADYPDADSFMRVFLLAGFLGDVGWQDPHYANWIAEATHLTNRTKRLELYRQADQYLVREQALLYPRSYGRAGLAAQPWVNNAHINPLGYLHFKNLVVEPH